jgi:site-specific DNA recombinase
LYQAFVEAFNALVGNKEYFIEKWKAEDGDCLRRYKAKEFIRIIENRGRIEKFDGDLFYMVIEKMSVFDGKRIVVGLLDGSEIEVVIKNK